MASYLQAQYRDFSAQVTMQFNGKRYTDFSNDNVYALEAFALFNFSLGKSWTFTRHQVDVIASIRNLLNEDYRLYSGRAMPGRHCAIQLTYQLNRKQNEN
jgi:iron complex outermembrane receptor protein